MRSSATEMTRDSAETLPIISMCAYSMKLETMSSRHLIRSISPLRYSSPEERSTPNAATLNTSW